MILTNCNNCKFITKCPETRKEVEKINNELKKLYDGELKKIQNKGFNEIEKCNHKEDLENHHKRLRIKKLKEVDKICVYEQKIAEETLNELFNKYNLGDNNYTMSIVNQIIKLKIYDFRLQIVHNYYSLFLETEHGLKLTPGITHSLDISTQITTMVEKLDRIIEGTTQNININVSTTEKIIQAYNEMKSIE